MEVKQIGNMDNDRENFKNPQCGRVYDNNGLSPTINTMGGGNREPMIFAMRGRNPNNPSDRTAGIPTITSTETGICKIESLYRIRKLTPKECWRLMGFSDEDFHKAEEVNSNSQLYKQAGNSIVKNMLMAILGQMIPRKENIYKEL